MAMSMTSMTSAALSDSRRVNGNKGIQHVLVFTEHEYAIACGALRATAGNYKELPTTSVEVKRMYTVSSARNRGVASALLAALEKWAIELGHTHTCLETGTRQPDVIRLYEKNGYQLIQNYGPYAGMENSKCFMKKL